MDNPLDQKDSPFRSPIASQIERFLQFKRVAGYKYCKEEEELIGLDRFLASQFMAAEPIITDKIVRAYLAHIRHTSETTRDSRLSLIRQLCCFIALEEPKTFIPPNGFLGIHRRLLVPRVLTRTEGKKFVTACLNFPAGRCSPLRGIVHGTALLLLYLTGMRLGEALSLNLEDADLKNGVLRIRQSKFGKSRLVPLAQDLANRMRQCQHFIEQSMGTRPGNASFFPGLRTPRCTNTTAYFLNHR